MLSPRIVTSDYELETSQPVSLNGRANGGSDARSPVTHIEIRSNLCLGRSPHEAVVRRCRGCDGYRLRPLEK